MKRSNNSGFTLVELLVVIAIIAIMGTLAIPEWDFGGSKLRSGAAEMYSLFQEAKMSAIKHNIPVVFAMDDADPRKWKLWEDINRDSSYTAGTDTGYQEGRIGIEEWKNFITGTVEYATVFDLMDKDNAILPALLQSVDNATPFDVDDGAKLGSDRKITFMPNGRISWIGNANNFTAIYMYRVVKGEVKGRPFAVIIKDNGYIELQNFYPNPSGTVEWN